MSIAVSDDDRVFVVVSESDGKPNFPTVTLKLVEIVDDAAVPVTDLYTTPQGQGMFAEVSDMAIRGDRIYVTRIGDQTVGVPSSSLVVVDADTGELLDPIGLGSNTFANIPTRVVIAPDGEHAYVLSVYGVVGVISFADTATV